MEIAMAGHAELLKEIDTLPPKYFGEVIDFVGYLRQKEKSENGADGAVNKTIVGEWCNPLYGLAKEKGATLTLGHFLEIQQKENTREKENDQRLWGIK